jgi:ATP-dependent Clp protease adaptor protein ClpS
MEEIPKQGQFEPEQDEEVLTGLPFKVIIYNDDWHTFDEVIIQLIKDVNCTFEQARGYAFEVHIKGKAIVFNGMLEECLKVSSILEEIQLNTQITS